MTQYYVKVNSNEPLPLFSWDALNFRGCFQLHLATDDLATIKEMFTDIETIIILNGDNKEVAHFTEFDGYSSITYVGRSYSPLINGFANELVVTLTKVNIIAQVQRLDEQINHTVDPATLSFEELKEYKIKQFSKQGEQAIFNGTDVALLNGSVKNFTYNLEDQSNLLNALFIIDQLDDLTITLPYHGHGEPCELYSALDILLVYFTLQFFSTRIQTRVNMLNSWVRDCETREEVEAIEFTSELPQEYVERMEAIIGPSMALAEQLRHKYFPENVEGGAPENVDDTTEPAQETLDENEGE